MDSSSSTPPTRSSSRRWDLPHLMVPRLGGYAHIQETGQDEEDITLQASTSTRPHSIPRKPLPNASVETLVVHGSSMNGTTEVGSITGDYDDLGPVEELHRDSMPYLVFSVIAALIPPAFLVLAIITVVLDGKPLSNWGEKVQKALLLVPTVYPILFAGLTSKSLRSYAVDLAARGTTLGTLEQFLGSGTFGGTIVTAFVLRLANVTTLMLFAIWSLSPLGGQAALRMLDTHKFMTTNESADIWHLSSDSEPWLTGGSAISRVVSMVDATFISSILAPESARQDTTDMYGKIKIPLIEPLETNKSTSDGWLTVAEDYGRFSSLAGIPHMVYPNPNPDAHGVFNMETSYFKFDCEKPLNFSQHMIPGPVRDGFSAQAPHGSSIRAQTLYLNLTEAEYKSGRMTNRNAASGPRKMEFASRMGHVYHPALNETTAYFAYAQCSMTTTYVESTVTCKDKRCRVTAMRRSLLDHAAEHLSVMDGIGDATNINFYSLFNFAGAPASSGLDSPSERYLAKSDDSWSMINNVQETANVVAVDKEAFSERLGTLVNTYWTIFQAPVTVNAAAEKLISDVPDPIYHGLPPNTKVTTRGEAKPFDPINYPYLAEKSKAQYILYEERYYCIWGWLTCFGISAGIFTIVSLVGLFCQFQRIAPDIFYVSGLTRDTPYIRVDGEPGLTAMDGGIKAFKLKNMKVMIADVMPEEKVGKVALIAVDEKMGEKVKDWGKLQWHRKYL
ncbi:hypothetical protein EX30DRAFT_366924 [Ascodesmis nigricans]|uniref:Uncharacterized protein n=1 Tax=Ascodesmis nigricans TaxID=341454 RepID=A0A4S2MJG4_9PEZI|nr:hypothetical protein EX30DRAFT_366924 [Ascodesmis nigricans]